MQHLRNRLYTTAAPSSEKETSAIVVLTQSRRAFFQSWYRAAPVGYGGWKLFLSFFFFFLHKKPLSLAPSFFSDTTPYIYIKLTLLCFYLAFQPWFKHVKILVAYIEKFKLSAFHTNDVRGSKRLRYQDVIQDDMKNCWFSLWNLSNENGRPKLNIKWFYFKPKQVDMPY